MTQLAPGGTPPASPSCVRPLRRADSQFSAWTSTSRGASCPLNEVTTNFQTDGVKFSAL